MKINVKNPLCYWNLDVMDQMDRRQNIENQKVTEKYQLFILHFTDFKSVLNDCIKKAEY